MSTATIRRTLEGAKAIVAALGIDKRGTERALVRSWTRHEGMPARFIRGHWYADEAELLTWWDSRRGNLAARAA